MREKMTAFLPCRKGSERIKNKNTKIFSGNECGLIGLKISQLLKTKLIDEIIVSSNDEVVLDTAEAFNDNRIKIDHRDPSLCGSLSSTDDLIKHVPNVIDEGCVLWTHTTSPFVNEQDYDECIKIYKRKKEYDSLMSVNCFKEFLWDNEGPVNYDLQKEKWPRTQTLESLYTINSAIFIASIGTYIKKLNRIGDKPFLYEMGKIQGWEIDWKEDFDIAEKIFQIRNNEE
jgi:CMP-N-acetylneuraminic acid synthetase